MVLFQLLLVVMITLSATVSAAVEHRHTSVDEVADDQQACCSESSERTQTCHALSALLPNADLSDTIPAPRKDVSIVAGLPYRGDRRLCG